MAGASKFGGTENGADCSKCGGTVAVLFKTRNGTSLIDGRVASVVQPVRYLTVRYMFFKVTLQSNAALFVSLNELVIIRITY